MSDKKVSQAILSKQKTVEEIKEKISRAKSVVIAEYKGLTVAEDTQLRREFRKNDVEYKVLKNTLIKRALNELDYTEFDECLVGTTSVAFGYGDEVSAAKIINESSKQFKNKIRAKSGLVDGAYLDEAGVRALADIPSREVLLARMLGSMNAPVTNFAGVLAAMLRSLVYAVKAVHDKQAEA